MKNLNKYERKTLIIGILVGMINVSQYIFIMIPKLELSYFTLFIVIPFVGLMVYLALCFEDFEAEFVAKTVESSTIVNSAPFVKLSMYILLLPIVIYLFFNHDVFGFYLLVVVEFILVGNIYPMYHTIDVMKLW